MSKKIMVLEVEKFGDIRTAVLSYQTIADCMSTEVLVMLSCKGAHYLVPHEIMKECDTMVYQHNRDREALNTLPPITVAREQCIPIPGETAKILLEL